MSPEGSGAGAGHDLAPGPFDMPTTVPFLTGVYLAINGIRDVYLVVDGPNCVFFRIPQIQANHDWHADLARTSGRHRIVDTDATPTRVAQGDSPLLRQRLREVDGLPDCAAILLTPMAHVAITGVQYDLLLSSLDPPLRRPVIQVREGSLTGDWLDGYARVLESLAAQLPLESAEDDEPASGASRRPRVAVVGHLYHRNEADVRADVAELRRLVTLLGAEAVSLWPDGGPLSGLQAAGRADLVVSMPYAGRAGEILAERVGAAHLSAALPLGLEASGRFLEDLGQALGRPEAAQAAREAELQRVIPRLQWAVQHELLHRRVLLALDPMLLEAMSAALTELGCQVVVEASFSRRHGAATGDAADPVAGGSRGGAPLRLVAPGVRDLCAALEPLRGPGTEDLDLAVICSEAQEALGAGGPPLPFLEVGFPAYYTHAFHPTPILGYEGVLSLVTRLINELRRSAASRGK